MNLNFSIFETALLKTSIVTAITVYRSRTGRGLREAKFAKDRVSQSSIESTISLSQEESLLVTEGKHNETQRKDFFQTAEKLYLKRTSSLPPIFLIGDESGTRDGIESNYFFSTPEQVEKYAREDMYSYLEINNFRLEKDKFIFNGDGCEWIITIHPIEAYA